MIEIKYFLDTSAIWHINRIKKTNPHILNFPIVVSSESYNYRFLNLFIPKAEIIVWNYINSYCGGIPLNKELKVLKTALIYENEQAPDCLIYVTHNKTLGFLANHYFGEDSVLII